jgi:transcriptional regulator with XRE-family HTH domain
MSRAQFDGEAFYAALDSQRQARRITWKKVAEESGISASTLTRIAQGRRPDVDSMAALLNWAGLSADTFVQSSEPTHAPEPLTQITTYLRADKNLSPEGVEAMEALIKSAYERLRKD